MTTAISTLKQDYHPGRLERSYPKCRRVEDDCTTVQFDTGKGALTNLPRKNYTSLDTVKSIPSLQKGRPEQRGVIESKPATFQRAGKDAQVSIGGGHSLPETARRAPWRASEKSKSMPIPVMKRPTSS